jgi:hypothetical protein
MLGPRLFSFLFWKRGIKLQTQQESERCEREVQTFMSNRVEELKDVLTTLTTWRGEVRSAPPEENSTTVP